MPLVVTCLAQSLRRLSVRVPRPRAVASAGAPPPAPAVDVSVTVAHAPAAGPYPAGAAYVSLEVSAVAAPCAAGGPAFAVSLLYGGVFSLDGVPPESVDGVLMCECARLLFPYARAVLAGAVGRSGFSPLGLQPIDFDAAWAGGMARRAVISPGTLLLDAGTPTFGSA